MRHPGRTRLPRSPPYARLREASAIVPCPFRLLPSAEVRLVPSCEVRIVRLQEFPAAVLLDEALHEPCLVASRVLDPPAILIAVVPPNLPCLRVGSLHSFQELDGVHCRGCHR